MELDEISNDSAKTNLSNSSDETNFLFAEEDFTYTPFIEELQLKIDNIISTANLGCPLNLKNISQKFKNVEFNKNSSLLLKSKDNKIMANIFSNGKMICSGAKSEKEAKSACIKFSKLVKKVGFQVELKDFKIQNIVASYDVRFKINLSKLYSKINDLNLKNASHSNCCKYNKDNFPGFIFHINDGKISLIVFESGKIVISGCKKRKEIENIFKDIYPFLIDSKKNNDYEQ